MDYWKVWNDVKRCCSRAMNHHSCKWLILASNLILYIWIDSTGLGSLTPYRNSEHTDVSTRYESIYASLLNPGRVLTFVDVHTSGSTAWVRDMYYLAYGGINHMLGMTWLCVLLPFSLFFMGKICFERDQKDVHQLSFDAVFSWPAQLIGLLLMGMSLLLPAFLLILLVDTTGLLEVVYRRRDFFVLVCVFVAVISFITSIIFYYRKNLEQTYFKLRGSWLLFAILVPMGGLCLNGTFSFSNENNELTPENEIHSSIDIYGHVIPGSIDSHLDLNNQSQSSLYETKTVSIKKVPNFSLAGSPVTLHDQGMMKCLLIWIPGVLMVMVGSRRNQWSL